MNEVGKVSESVLSLERSFGVRGSTSNQIAHRSRCFDRRVEPEIFDVEMDEFNGSIRAQFFQRQSLGFAGKGLGRHHENQLRGELR